MDATKVAVGGGLFGDTHACLITSSGVVRCWGDNSDGQLGDGSISFRSTPVNVVGLGGGVQDVGVGDGFACALTAAGTVKCWGRNFSGQLGNGDAFGTFEVLPVDAVGLGTGVQAISVGMTHACAVTSAGAVQCWGSNFAGKLGDGTTVDRETPVTVVGLGSGHRAVAAGGRHSCALSATGAVLCWGRGAALGNGGTTDSLTPVNVTGLSSGVQAIRAGGELNSSHTCAINAAGGVVCWGSGGSGQLGDGGTSSRTAPVAVIGSGSGVAAISVGLSYTCAVTTAGVAQCWGTNADGQVGDGSFANRLTPVTVTGLVSGVSAIGAGLYHTCGVLQNGGLKCWGRNRDGQLGNGGNTLRTTPGGVVGLANGVAAISAGQSHTCAITSTGGARCWGSNFSRQLGAGSTNFSELTPLNVTGLASGVQMIDSGEANPCALVAGGVTCWGTKTTSQTGSGSSGIGQSTPTSVASLTSGVAEVRAGGKHRCARTMTGEVRCWGGNFYGQLGNGFDGSSASQPEPVSVTGLTGVQAISTGENHSCGLTSGGGVKCWGRNTSGQLGDGSTLNRNMPVDVVGLSSGVTAVSAGANHTCAVTSGGSVKCWGTNGSGQLGDGSTTQRLAPADVVGLGSGVAAITAGGAHTCIRLGNGSAKCWGGNTSGQLGDGSSTQRLAPTDVVGLVSGVVAISAGGAHTCAIGNGGAAKCWGNAGSGQVGDGANHGVPVPQTVLIDASVAVVDITIFGNDMSLAPASDASGSYVVFQSRASNLGPANTPGTLDIYRADTRTQNRILLSTNNDGSPLGADAIEPSVSADGEIAVFVAADAGVSNVANESPRKTVALGKAGGFSVLMRNLITGSTQRMAFPALPSGAGTTPQISPSGNGIVYTGPTPAGMGDPAFNAILEVPLIKQPNGSRTLGTPRCLSCKAVNANGSDSGENANGHSRHATMSADGRYVAWETEAKNLLVGNASLCPNASTEIVLRDLVTRTTQRISMPPSVDNCGAAGTGARKPKIDWSGRKIVFESDQPLKPGDANGAPDIYLRDITQTSLTRISETAAGGDAAGASTEPAISGDGQIVGYISAAADLDNTEADTNAKADVHVRSLRDALTRRLSKTRDGAEADSDSRRPAMSYNGTQLAFDSDAGNLAPGAQAGVQNVFQRANPLNSLTVFAAGFD